MKASTTKCWCTNSGGGRRVHDLPFPRLPALVIHVDGQRGEDEQEFLGADFDGTQRVERVVRDERDARVLGLDERQRVLVAHQAVHGESRLVTDHQAAVGYHVEALRRRRQQDVPEPLVARFRSRYLKQQHLHPLKRG